MKKIKSLVALASIFTAANAIAGGLTASGKISLLSHEVSGSYVQILDAASTVINTDPDTCGGADMYFLPLDHANYTVLSSSLLTAEMTQRELAFHVEGCENGMAKIAFVRFGNWDGVVLNTPVEVTTTPPTEIGGGRKVFKATGVASYSTNFTVPDAVETVFVTMCGGGGAGGAGHSGGGGGASTILKKPYLVTPKEVISVTAGGGGQGGQCGYSTNCPPGRDSIFGILTAQGAWSGARIYWTSDLHSGETGQLIGFDQNSKYMVSGGRGGIAYPIDNPVDGVAVAGNPGGIGAISTYRGGGGGASFFGRGGNGAINSKAEDGQGYCSGGGGSSSSSYAGGNGAPGIVIVEW